jgi:hypothetical protein
MEEISSGKSETKLVFRERVFSLEWKWRRSPVGRVVCYSPRERVFSMEWKWSRSPVGRVMSPRFMRTSQFTWAT